MAKGMLIPVDGGGSPVKFQWNPVSINRRAGANYATLDVQGKEGPLLQFANGSQKSLMLELEAIRYTSDSDVQNLIDALEALCDPSVKMGGTSRAPRVRFSYGGQTPKWNCVVQAVDSRIMETLSGSLLPFRAMISVSLYRWVD